MTTMRGTTCLVTGGTSGIGKSTAWELARRGATVAIVGRDAEKTARVADAIRVGTGNVAVDAFVADLSSQREVRRLVEEFEDRHARLHVLLNVAGAVFLRRRESVDGIEMTFALNHLGPFLLTNLLLDTLVRSAPARVVTVSSGAHASGRIDFSDLQGERSFGPRKYDDSKLANVLFTVELARRLEGTGVTANALHPGFVATGFATNNGALVAALVRTLAPLFGRSPAQGARTPVHLATSPAVEGVSGKYFYDSRMVAAAPQAHDTAVARRLWEVSATLVAGCGADGVAGAYPAAAR